MAYMIIKEVFDFKQTEIHLKCNRFLFLCYVIDININLIYYKIRGYNLGGNTLKTCDKCNTCVKDSHINFYTSLNQMVCDFCLLGEENEYEDYLFYMTHIADAHHDVESTV